MSYNVGTAGKIAVFSSANYSMEYATLNLVNEAENILKHVSLIKECSGALVSDTVTFPTGSFSYYLVGTDTSGIAFNSYHMKQQVTFQQPHFDYDSVLSFDAHSAVEMDIDEIFTLNFNFTNHWTYSTYFNFTGNTPAGFANLVRPQYALVVAGGSVKIEMLVRIIHPSIKRGTAHTVSVSASICYGDAVKSASRTVAIVSCYFTHITESILH